MTTHVKIKKGGLLAPSTLIIDTGRSEKVIKASKFKIEELDGRYELTYTPAPSSSFGVTSRGPISTRRYTHAQKAVMVDSYEYI